MHIVYYVRPGENEELRYSLRSVEANVPDPHVTVVGDAPSWLDKNEAEFLQGNGMDPSRAEGKYGNALNNIRIATHSHRGDFVVFNDDFMVLQPMKETVPFYSRHALDNHVAQTPTNVEEAAYRKKLLARASTYLKSHGVVTPMSYETHLPMPINGARLWDEMERYWDWWSFSKEAPLMWRTVYANMQTDGTHVNRQDVITHAASELEEAVDFVSTVDRSFDNLRDLLDIRFPEPSRWETC